MPAVCIGSVVEVKLIFICWVNIYSVSDLGEKGDQARTLCAQGASSLMRERTLGEDHHPTKQSVGCARSETKQGHRRFQLGCQGRLRQKKKQPLARPARGWKYRRGGRGEEGTPRRSSQHHLRLRGSAPEGMLGAKETGGLPVPGPARKKLGHRHPHPENKQKVDGRQSAEVAGQTSASGT